MAYMSQEKKAKLAPAIKKILKKYGMKGTLAVRHHSTLVLNIKSGKLDMIGNYNATMGENHVAMSRGFQPATTYIDVNPYHFQNHFTGKAKSFLLEIYEAMMTGNHDNSDPYTDYFDVGWYVDINIGKWSKAYQLEV